MKKKKNTSDVDMQMVSTLFNQGGPILAQFCQNFFFFFFIACMSEFQNGSNGNLE